MIPFSADALLTIKKLKLEIRHGTLVAWLVMLGESSTRRGFFIMGNPSYAATPPQSYPTRNKGLVRPSGTNQWFRRLVIPIYQKLNPESTAFQTWKKKRELFLTVPSLTSWCMNSWRFKFWAAGAHCKCCCLFGDGSLSTMAPQNHEKSSSLASEYGL